MRTAKSARPVEASGTFELGGDLKVNRLGYGAMQLTGPGVWGDPKDPAEAVRVLQRAVELGVNFIDTADAYGPFVSEQLIKKALHPYAKGLIIATKAGLTRQGPNIWTPVGRAEYLRQQASSACGTWAWSASICCSSTASTPRCRSPNRSENSAHFRKRARFGTLA